MARTLLGVKVDDNERAIVVRLAAEQERTLSDVVRRLIRQAAKERATTDDRRSAEQAAGVST